MMNERMKELVNGELDDVLSPEEHAELQRGLQSQPAVADLKRDMEKVFSLLESVSGDVEPPKDLRLQIAQTLTQHQNDHRYSSASNGIRQFVLSIFGRPAIVFAMGMIAAVILLAVGNAVIRTNSTVDPSQVYGTLTVNMSAGGNEIPTAIHFSNEKYRADITMKPDGHKLLTRIVVQTPDQANLQFQFDRKQLGVIGFQQFSGEYSTLTAGEGASIAVQPGDHECAFEFERQTVESVTLYVTMYAANSLVFERRIVLNQKS